MKLREIAELTQQERDQFEINRNNIEQWLTRMKIERFTIDPTTNIVNVDGDVDLSKKSFITLPVQFGTVSGGFFLGACTRLMTLRGCPHTVGGTFHCFNTAIRSLEGAPSVVGVTFACDGTPNMKSLSGIEKIVREVRAEFWGSPTVTHVLGLLLIKGIQHIDLDGTGGPINTILNKYIGTGDIISAQDELIDAGFVEQARL